MKKLRQIEALKEKPLLSLEETGYGTRTETSFEENNC
jgi:hypothetical protein